MTDETDARDFDEATQEVLEDALEDADPGEQASAQTEGQIENEHDGHVDGFSGTKEDDGSVTVEKEHTET